MNILFLLISSLIAAFIGVATEIDSFLAASFILMVMGFAE